MGDEKQSVVVIGGKPFRKASRAEIKVCALEAQMFDKFDKLPCDNFTITLNYRHGTPMVPMDTNLFIHLCWMLYACTGVKFTPAAIHIEQIYSVILTEYGVEKQYHLNSELRKWLFLFYTRTYLSRFYLDLSRKIGTPQLYKDVLSLEKPKDVVSDEEYKARSKTIIERYHITENDLDYLKELLLDIEEYQEKKLKMKIFSPLFKKFEEEFKLVLPVIKSI